MMLARPAALASVMLAAALLLAACGGDDSDEPTATPIAAAGTATEGGQPSKGMSVTSDDGAATLEIPEGALPAGVDGSAIRVTTVSMAEPRPLEAPDPEAEEQPSVVVAAVRLEPAGLRFLRPVTLTVILPSEIVTGPLVALHSSEEGVEPLAIELTDGPESGQIEVTTSVEHFSGVFFVSASIEDEDIVEADLIVSPETVTVGDEFTASVNVRRRDGMRTVDVRIRVQTLEEHRAHAYSDFQMSYVLTVERLSWRLGGEFGHLIFGGVSPERVPDKPAEFLRVRGDAHLEEAIFKCERAGRWSVFYAATAFVEYAAMPASLPAGVELPQFGSAPHVVTPFVSARVICVAAPEEAPTEGPTETPIEPPRGGTASTTVEIPGQTVTCTSPQTVTFGTTFDVGCNVKNADGTPGQGTFFVTFAGDDPAGPDAQHRDGELDANGNIQFQVGVSLPSGTVAQLLFFYPDAVHKLRDIEVR